MHIFAHTPFFNYPSFLLPILDCVGVVPGDNRVQEKGMEGAKPRFGKEAFGQRCGEFTGMEVSGERARMGRMGRTGRMGDERGVVCS